MLWSAPVGMAVPQITIRLDHTTKAAFEAYAAKFGLMASELAKLLIIREQLHGRLAGAIARGELRERQRRAGGRDDPLPKITAHFSTLEQVAAFDAHIAKFGGKRPVVGIWLLEDELRERWLERAINAK